MGETEDFNFTNFFDYLYKNLGFVFMIVTAFALHAFSALRCDDPSRYEDKVKYKFKTLHVNKTHI